MKSINPIDLISVAAFAAVVLMVLAWRILVHDRDRSNNLGRGGDHNGRGGDGHRAIRGASVMVFIGALLGTFAAAVVFGWLYRWTDHGFGLLVLGAVLAFCGGDFYFQVVRDHPEKTDRVRTPWVAAAGLGIAGMLFFGNITHIAHSIQQEAHLGKVTAVFTDIHKNG